ncbi:metallophosphoesterase family protein [Bacillus sp. SM2101]|uniref:metallophosphoesterase family protein n=1 Tax=Bacillus sp. SM2101 TaxID=2805366 RepID=UPI001BDF36F2|nr:metallophosphoesterase family protein [Bacillus sp. SM2101]
MERIALVSDIHGNIPALEAVLLDIKQRGIEKIYCLGDLVGKGPHPEKSIDIIRDTCDIVVQGNWDDFLPNETNNTYIQWYQHRLNSEQLSYIKSLPFSHDFMMSGRKIRLFHASSTSVHHRVYPWDSLDKRKEMFTNTEKTGGLNGRKPDVVCYGDIHYAFIHHIQEKVLINVGSVGNPLDMTQASYVILEGDNGSDVESSFAIQLVRVPYDIELAIRQAREEGMPELEPYIDELRTATYRGLKK